MKEILPALGKECKTRSDYSHLSIFWAKNSVSLNGTSLLALRWVQALEMLTHRNSVQYLTMLTWSGVIPQNGILRGTKSWCSLCYEEWHRSNQVIYDPLLWALDPITVCPLHRKKLQCICPYDDCKKLQPLFARQSYPGHCSRCGRWLGGFDTEEILLEELNWQLWVATAVGEMVASVSHTPYIPQKEEVARTVSMYVDKCAGGNMAALAQRLQLPKSVLFRWKNGQSLPRFTTLLQVCYRLNVPPLRFLTGSVGEFTSTQYEEVQDLKVGSGKYRKLDIEETRRVLEAVVADDKKPSPPFTEVARLLDQDPRVLQRLFPDLYRAIVTRHREQFHAHEVQYMLEEILQSEQAPFPSMHEVARRLGHSVMVLRRHFPILCKQISANYQAYLKRRALARKERIRDEVRKAVQDIHSKGKYPSTRLVASLLTRPQAIREQETLEAWREALRELGLKP